MDSIFCTMVQGEAELEVEVQHIHPMEVSQSPTVEVALNHVITQLGSLVLNLR